jgi:hypothetical protein
MPLVPAPVHITDLIQQSRLVVKESIDIEYRVSDRKILESIGISISNTGTEVSEYRISNTEKSIGCPALVLTINNYHE